MPSQSREDLAEKSLEFDPSPPGMKMSQGTLFIELLEMLQKEHYRALSSLQNEMEAKLEAMQSEVLDTRCVPYNQLKTEKHTELRQLCFEVSNGSTSTILQQDFNREVSPSISDVESMFKTPNTITSHDDLFKTDIQASELAGLSSFVSLREGKRSAKQVDDANLPQWRQNLLKCIQSRRFDSACAFAIITHAALLGIQVDYTARRVSDPFGGPLVFRILDRIYTGCFVCELLMKFLVYGASFWYRPDWSWNVFDFIVVSADAIQAVFELATNEDGNAMRNYTALRVLRVLRITRAVKVVRLVRFFRELRLMILSVMRCGMSLMWSMIMFFLVIYIFAIFIMSAVAIRVYDNKSDMHYDHYREYWSSLPLGMWTLFSCMSGGVSWMEVGNPLLAISWAYAGTLGFFMFFTIFVVTNIITGVFVDTAIQNAQGDRDDVIQGQLAERDSARVELQQVFMEADYDQSGTLTIEEFAVHLENEKVRAHLMAIGLHVDEALSLFKLLDIHRTNAISIEEFLFGCMRLKGSATSIDLATLMYENKRVVEGLKNFQKDTGKSLQLVLRKLGSLERIKKAGSIERVDDTLMSVHAPESTCIPSASLKCI